MPLYEYECEVCRQRFERIMKYSDPLIEVCPLCGKSPVRKLLSSPAIQFKGSGFYITDYAKKSSSEAGSKSSSEGSSSESKGDSKSTESKSSDSKSSDSSSTSTTKKD
jgi:putative FmdB family regulatory protein